MPNILKLLFSPSGRIGRRDYLIGLVGLVFIFSIYGLLINALGGSMFGFFAVLAFPFIILQIAYSVYGKRLHDIGRTLWPLTGLLCAMLLAMIVVMLVYGGADYFAAYSEYSRDNPPPAEVVEKLNAEFKPRQEQGEAVLSLVILSLLTAFTLWLALAKPQAGQNAYGAATKG
ncbi:MAG: DUF805 domain-containing protein [Litorimonas sp.]